MVELLRQGDEQRFLLLMRQHLEESKAVCLAAVDGRLLRADPSKS